jgi:hypothetical protein
MIHHHHGNASQHCPPLLGREEAVSMSIWFCQIEAKDPLQPHLLVLVYSLPHPTFFFGYEKGNWMEMESIFLPDDLIPISASRGLLHLIPGSIAVPRTNDALNHIRGGTQVSVMCRQRLPHPYHFRDQFYRLTMMKIVLCREECICTPSPM